MDLSLTHLRRITAVLFGSLLALFLATSGPDYLALLEGKIHPEDAIFSRQVLEYEYAADGSVTYDYLAEALPPLLDPKEDPTLRTEYSYTTYLGTNDKGEGIYELIAYTDKTYAREGGQWFARETATTDRATFAAARQRDPIAGLFWERAVAVDYYAGAGDGYIDSFATETLDGCNPASVWAVSRGGGGANANPTPASAFVGGLQNYINEISPDPDTCETNILRTFLPFNTAAIPSGATVVSSSLSMYVLTKVNDDNDGTDYITVLRTSQGTHTTLIAGNFGSIGSTEGVDSGQRKDITSISTSAYLTFTLNTTGLGWVAKSGQASNCSATTGITCLGLREGHDLVDSIVAANMSSQVEIATSEATGTSQDPYLSVTYTGGTSALSKPPNNLGLVGFWSFNEGTSTVATDFSGNGWHGTLSGNAVTWVAGKKGTALQFGGTNDNVNVGNITALNNKDKITMSAWIYDTSGTVSRSIFSRWTSLQGSLLFYVSDAGAGGADDLQFSPDGQESAYTTGNLHQTNRWEHWTVVYDGTLSDANKITFYLNGVAQAETLSSTPIGATTDSSSDVFRIGADSDEAADFIGRIDDMRVYTRALTATEVASLYGSGAIRVLGSSATLTNGTTLGRVNGLVGHWSFDGGDTQWSSAAAGTMLDGSGNGNTAAISNMSRSASVTIGKLGQAFTFDGSDDFVRTSSAFNVGSSVATVAFWMNWTLFPNTDDAVFTVGSFDSQSAAYDSIPDSTTGNFTFAISGTGGTGRIESIPRPAVGEWHHYAVVYNNSTTAGDITVYQDGAVQSTTMEFDTKNASGTLLSDNLVLMAALEGTDNFGNGKLDDFRIYNRELTAAEAKQLYLLGAAIIRP